VVEISGKSRKYKRTIEINFEALTTQTAKTIIKVLKPETVTSHAFGSHVHINRIKNKIQLTFKTNRTSTIRAIMNSYLRWIRMMTSSIEILNEEKTSKKYS
jgi:tRNA threonylcarbamoyladenosine modification (KEOPS) complex  Pcc1 subunit